MARSRIMVVDDERMIRWSIQQALLKDGHSVTSVETGEEAVAQASDEMPDLVFLDITLPGIDGIEVLRRLKAIEPSVTVVMVTATDDVKTAVEAMRLGAYDYVGKPFDLDRLRLMAQNALDRHELREEVEFHRKESVKKFGFHRVVGVSKRLSDVVEIARKVARSEAATVLLQGESGTGKDLLAQAIHYESRRANRPFIPINCTALPTELLESELMGHEKGAFTDAKAVKKGLFEVADGGTIYLDEVGDMKVDLQAKMLRFIETKTFKRVGGHRDIEVDVRIIAATNRDLQAAVRSGSFREDLFYRLNVIPIEMPPLRERREDILPLAEHFLALLNEEVKRKVHGFTGETRSALAEYDWPGNVREMRNLIERALILGEGEYLDIRPLSDLAGLQSSNVPSMTEWGTDRDAAGAAAGAIVGTTNPETGRAGVGPRAAEAGGGDAVVFILPPRGVVLEEVEKTFIIQALGAQDGNQTKAAAMLGLTRDALRYRMKKFGFLE